MLYKTEGIVIRSQDYGESNKIITLYTREYGKISLMARGARKPKSRLSSIVQLFTYGMYMFYRGSTKSMGTLSQGEAITTFPQLRQDLVKTAYGAYTVELVDKIIDQGEGDPQLFQLLYMTCHHLDEGKDPEILTRLFELKMLVLGGYRPVLDQCVSCGQKEGKFGFSIREGGFLCERCRQIDPDALELAVPTLKLLHMLYHFDLERLGEINVRDKVKDELRQAIWLFMDYHTPWQLKSRRFLEQMTTITTSIDKEPKND